jgi:hypothetical protein
MKAREIQDIFGDEVKPYSGRGMFGRSCPSLVGDSVLEVASRIVNECNATTARWLINNAKTDNMGTGVVVYWPSIGLLHSDNA